jgi:hypothetical protein
MQILITVPRVASRLAVNWVKKCAQTMNARIRKAEKKRLTPNYSRISGIAYENGYVRENSSKTDTLQSFPPNKGALLPWGSDNF